MGNWLALELNLEPKTFPSILKAYRMGSKKPDRVFPGDINVQFANLRVKKRIQNLARERNGLEFNKKKILVFPDLPFEALAIRKELKPVLKKLQEAQIRYCWSSPGRLMVNHKNKQLFAWDLDSGNDLLASLEFEEDMETDLLKRASKRRLALPTLTG